MNFLYSSSLLLLCRNGSGTGCLLLCDDGEKNLRMSDPFPLLWRPRRSTKMVRARSAFLHKNDNFLFLDFFDGFSKHYPKYYGTAAWTWCMGVCEWMILRVHRLEIIHFWFFFSPCYLFATRSSLDTCNALKPLIFSPERRCRPKNIRLWWEKRSSPKTYFSGGGENSQSYVVLLDSSWIIFVVYPVIGGQRCDWNFRHPMHSWLVEKFES